MGIYHFVLYFFRRKDKSPVYFGILCLLLVTRTLVMEERIIMDWFAFIPFMTIYKFEYITAYSGLASFVLFVHCLFPKEFSKKYLIVVLLISIPATLLAIFFSPYIYASSWVLKTVQIVILLSIVYTEVILVVAVKNKRMGSLIFIAGTVIFFIAITNDILYSFGIIHTVHISIYGFLTFIFSQAVVLAMRFSNAFTLTENQAVELKDKTDSLRTSNLELTELKEGLEIKVEERTEKLEAAYKKNLQEEQKVAKLEAEIFTIQERENLFFDIHDHIKGDVSELGLLIEKIKGYQIPLDVSNQASLLLKRVATSVKNRMLMLEDKQLLEEDFSNGLQMSLLRRYTALNRRFTFELEESAANTLSQTSTEFKTNFYSIATEISTNDLKYGHGDSFWRIEVLDSKEIKLEMRANSKFTTSLDTGKGHIGISRKVEILHGRVEEEIKDGLYKIKIWLPV